MFARFALINSLLQRNVIVSLAFFMLFSYTASNGAMPAWPLEVLSFNLTKAYPGIPYEWRLGIKGGAYPYTFTLISGPAGMIIDARKGTIRWTPPATSSAGNTVNITITDSKGAVLNHNYSIDVTATGFFFVAASGNDASGDGSINNPWLTLGRAQASALAGIVYVRTGTYAASGVDGGKWFVFPEESVVWDCGGAGNISPRSDSSAFIGLEIRNSGIHMFHLDGTFKNAIWRNNKMHDIQAGASWENPAFIFAMDGNARPIEGSVQYDRIVVQDNLFYNLFCSTGHAASLTGYNLKNLLYEDNEVYDIGGRGVSDKDDGYYNTFRNNIIHDCDIGVGLFSQYTQGQIEICYNLIYNCPTAIVIGSQPGYVRDVFVHHNTISGGSINFGVITDDTTQSKNFNINNNIIIANGAGLIYEFSPVSTGSSGYRYQAWVGDLDKSAIDSNLIWTTSASAIVAGFDWGLTNKSFTQWQALGYDVHGVLANPNLAASYALPAGSPYLGKFGRDIDGSTAIKQKTFSARAMRPALSGGVHSFDVSGRAIRATNTVKSTRVVIEPNGAKAKIRMQAHERTPLFR